MSFVFSKYSGLGNDFIFVDNRVLFFPTNPSFIQTLCDRHDGIGADGLVLLENSEGADAKMRIFNADGQEAEMCGNALRCFYLYLKELGYHKNSFFIETFDRLLKVEKMGDLISCEMGSVTPIQWDIPFELEGRHLLGHALNTGVPHVVIPVLDLQHAPVLAWGSSVRNDPRFHPSGTNVNFMIKNSLGEIEVRTYERGVENETWACGTGCAASAIIASKLFNLKAPITVKTASNKELFFEFEWVDNHPQNLKMKGEAYKTFSGEASLPIQIKIDYKI